MPARQGAETGQTPNMEAATGGDLSAMPGCGYHADGEQMVHRRTKMAAMGPVVKGKPV